MFGYMEGVKKGYIWRPKPLNCEVRIYESDGGRRQFLAKYSAD